MFNSKIIFLSFLILSGCSLLKKNDAESPGSEPSAKGPANTTDTGLVVVTQPGRKTSVYPERDSQFWLNLRSDPKQNSQIEAYLASGDPKGASDIARKRLEKTPGDKETLRLLSASLALSRNYDLAGYYAEEVLKTEPQNADALNIRALAFFFTAQSPLEFKKAVELFQAAHHASGSHVAAGLNLGSLMLELGQAKQAEGIFSEARTRCGDCIASLMGYGVAASRAGSYDSAKSAFETVLKKQPGNGVALFQLALVEKNGFKKQDLAEKHLQRILTDQIFKDPAVKQRANVVVRSFRSQGEQE